MYDLPCEYRVGLYYFWYDNTSVIFIVSYIGGKNHYWDCDEMVTYDTLFFDSVDENEEYIKYIELMYNSKRRNINKMAYDKIMGNEIEI